MENTFERENNLYSNDWLIERKQELQFLKDFGENIYFKSRRDKQEF